jgi:hypothetical protein
LQISAYKVLIKCCFLNFLLHQNPPSFFGSSEETPDIERLGATMEYHKTKDILHVMRLLGHKNIKNTLIYTQLVTFEDDDFICKTAENVKEAKELIEAGYEYVCDMSGL